MSNLTELEEFKKRIKKEINETKKDLSFLLGKYDGILAAISCIMEEKEIEIKEINSEKIEKKRTLLVKKKRGKKNKVSKDRIKKELLKNDKSFYTAIDIAQSIFDKKLTNFSGEYVTTRKVLKSLRNEKSDWLNFKKSGVNYIYWLSEDNQSEDNQKKKQIFNLSLEQKIENILEKNKSKSFGNIDLARIIFEKEVKVEDLEYREVAETMKSLIKKNPCWLKFVKRSNKWEYQYRSSGAFRSAKNIPQFPNLLK